MKHRSKEKDSPTTVAFAHRDPVLGPLLANDPACRRGTVVAPG